jgi:hypothetical protein
VLKAVNLNIIIMLIQLILKYGTQQNILEHKIQHLVLMPHTRATIISNKLVSIFQKEQDCYLHNPEYV